MLESLGLNRIEEGVYRLMLQRPGWGVAELAAALVCSDSEVHDALDALSELSLLRRSSGGAGKFDPISPSVGLAVLLAKAEAAVHERQRIIEEARASIATIIAEHSIGGSNETVTRLDGITAVRTRLEELSMLATSECLSFKPGPVHRTDAMDAARDLNAQALARGVVLRSIYQETVRNDDATLKFVRWLSGLGGETRTVASVPMLMVIVDRRVALLPVDPAEPRRGALEVQAPGLVAALCTLFDLVWASASLFGLPAVRDANGLEPSEVEMLRLLAAGYTDDMVARRLGCSLRTVRRNMSVLMERLDARSRFQAGLNAAKLGWL